MYLHLGSQDNHSLLVNLGKYGLQWTSTGHKGPINCLSFTEDGSYLASGSDDGHVLVWALHDGSLLQSMKPKQGPVVAIKWFAGGPPHAEPTTKVCYLLSAGANGTVVAWHFNMTLALFEWAHMKTVFDSAIDDDAPAPSVPSTVSIQTACGQAEQLFDLDGKTAITGSDNGQVVIWDISTGQQIFMLYKLSMKVKYHALQFTKHYIASGSLDGSEEQPLLWLWSTEVSITSYRIDMQLQRKHL
ncbi:WD40-repeat-containing domain protein [Pisolithus orientalis]|uniref:WD40-repeat-containing domain protein n=1 Tax=Pisolithus orientalis TaxID=936130 RepID=UPI00222503BB|nr:WD40-repeat-containing domain protein [Pisolithus orientalis]KAI6030666.1 WD40-repeat-containing domain protein [Pisolithus orientalis]